MIVGISLNVFQTGDRRRSLDLDLHIPVYSAMQNFDFQTSITTLSDRIERFKTYIPIQETKLYNRTAFVEKKFFLDENG